MRRKIEQRLDIKLKEDPFNKPQPNVGRAEAVPTPSGPSQPIAETYKAAIKQKTGLGTSTFSPKMSTTISNLQTILSQVPRGTEYTVVPGEEDGVVNLNRGDQLIRSFNVKAIDKNTQQRYVNELSQTLANLPSLDEISLYIQGQQSGGIDYSQF
jgi:hypothetical protein